MQNFDVVEFDVVNQHGTAAPCGDESGCFNHRELRRQCSALLKLVNSSAKEGRARYFPSVVFSCMLRTSLSVALSSALLHADAHTDIGDVVSMTGAADLAQGRVHVS